MSAPEMPSDDLRAVIGDLATDDAAELLAEARRAARLRAQRVLEDAFVEELLEATVRRHRPSPEPVRAAPDDRPEADRPQSAQLLWTYCVLAGQDAIRIAPQLEGIEPGTQVEAVSVGKLGALVSVVPLAEYGDQRLREHLEDLDWVERTARRHQAVLDEALREASIVPLRLCTLYRDLDGPRRLLQEHAASLMEALLRVEGCIEWGVKVFADPHAADAVPGDDLAAQADPVEDDERAAGGAGAAYLTRRQHERTRAEKARQNRTKCAEAAHGRISTLARESTTNPPQHPEAHGRDLVMLLNGAYLVERKRVGELQEAIKDLQAEWEPRGFLIELTGPWPAYNFVSGAIGVMP